MRRTGGADLLLDPLGRGLADQKVMVAAHVGDDGFVHLVAADADRTRIDDARQGQDGDLGGAAADVDDHRAGSARGSAGRAPMAAAMGSSIRPTRRAEALRQLSLMARRSTAVAPEGTQTMTLGFTKPLRL